MQQKGECLTNLYLVSKIVLLIRTLKNQYFNPQTENGRNFLLLKEGSQLPAESLDVLPLGEAHGKNVHSL